ncbi:MAG: DUF6798 domain-containing protein [Terracidiphilus sp.]
MDIFKKNNLLRLVGLTLLAFVTMGYHPGLEDDHVYLAAIKSDLHPQLYPHDAEFFRVQLQATVFDKLMAAFVRLSRIPVPYAELLWQLAAFLFILAACWSIARHLFEDEAAPWAGVALVGAMLTLPVSGTALTLADQHLHPRTLATALILLAVSAVLRRRFWIAATLLIAAVALHPIMAALGISFCIFLVLADWIPNRIPAQAARGSMMAAAPLGWIFDAPTPVWRQALETRRYFFLYRWTWYEWLGAIAPLVLFGWLWRWAERKGDARLSRFALAVLCYGVFQQVVAMVVLGVPGLVRLTPLQPMRYLHLVYYFLVLLTGCLLGKVMLRRSPLWWFGFLAVCYGGMFAGQRVLYPASVHLELPWTRSANPWVQAFQWIRENTPADAYFALDPEYMRAPGEEFHSFRALAERSELADAVKDAAVVAQVPDLGGEWQRQAGAVAGWNNFRLDDFERLKAEFGVNWALLRYPSAAGLHCVWHNAELEVCQIP